MPVVNFDSCTLPTIQNTPLRSVRTSDDASTTSTTKGKTWGPSTVHQRERTHLPPVMRSTTASSTQFPQFSKSAPNLDKSRIATAAIAAANMSLFHKAESMSDVDHQSLSASMHPHHKTSLGKSEEALSRLTPKAKRRGARVIGLMGERNGRAPDGPFGFEDNYNDYAEGDDEEVPASGCFAFIRSDDSSANSIHQGEPRSRKKFSLDSSYHLMSSPISNNNNNNTNPNQNVNVGVTPLTIGCSRPNLDDVNYDRVFYRGIQKSLENMFGRDDDHQSLASVHNKRNSRSSTVLTYDEYDNDQHWHDQYRSQFDRSCFLTANRQSLMLDDSSESPDDTFKSTELTAQLNDSAHLAEHFNRSVLLNSSTDSRKNSVTFRPEVESMDPFLEDNLGKDRLIDTASSNSTSIHNSKQASLNGFVPSRTNSSLKSALRHYPPSHAQQHIQATLSPSSANSLKEKNYLRTRLSRWFKRKSKDRGATAHSNSFYMKLDRFSGAGELSEQLLSAVATADEVDSQNLAHHHNGNGRHHQRQPNGDDCDVSNGDTSSSANSSVASGDGQAPMATVDDEPQYDAIFRTPHFFLARQND